MGSGGVPLEGNETEPPSPASWCVPRCWLMTCSTCLPSLPLTSPHSLTPSFHHTLSPPHSYPHSFSSQFPSLSFSHFPSLSLISLPTVPHSPPRSSSHSPALTFLHFPPFTFPHSPPHSSFHSPSPTSSSLTCPDSPLLIHPPHSSSRLFTHTLSFSSPLFYPPHLFYPLLFPLSRTLSLSSPRSSFPLLSSSFPDPSSLIPSLTHTNTLLLPSLTISFLPFFIPLPTLIHLLFCLHFPSHILQSPIAFPIAPSRPHFSFLFHFIEFFPLTSSFLLPHTLAFPHSPSACLPIHPILSFFFLSHPLFSPLLPSYSLTHSRLFLPLS